MVFDKIEFIKNFLPDKIEDMSYAQVDLDITDLSIPDILRNINSTYPLNSKCRNQIESGEFAVVIMCKSELISPLRGLMIIVAADDSPIEIISEKYLVAIVSEKTIKSDSGILDFSNELTKYMITNFKDVIEQFDAFYVKFIYNPEENNEWDDDYYDDDDEGSRLITED